jgi:type IV secretory pathway TraG/TraD family ATPase VirD4
MIDEFLDGGHHLHIVAPSRYQAVTAPLVVGLIHSVIHRTYDRPESRVLLALDEIANVAPLPDLATIVSEGGGLGVTTLACLQDLSQARQRWGDIAHGFLSLFPTSVVLPGITDRATLELVSLVAGTRETTQRTTQLNPRGRVNGHSLHQVSSARLSPADIARGAPHSALALTDRNEIHRLTLRPYYHERSMVRDRS